MTVPADAWAAAAGGAGLLLLVAKLWWPAPAPGWLATLFGAPLVAAVSGGLIVWGAPGWLHEGAQPLVDPMLSFLAGWVGLRVGCGLDLRVLRRQASAGFAAEAGALLAIAAAVGAAVWALTLLVPALAALHAGAVLVLAAICVSGPALPGSSTAVTRGASRGGFWTPSAAAAVAVGVAAVGISLGSAQTLQVRLPWLEVPILVGLDGSFERLAWGIATGCMVGLLADLATKDDFAPGGLYPQLAAVVLIGVGVAGVAGLDPVFVGAMAGFWLINATLRRLDILNVLERGALLPGLVAPFVAGWLVGGSLRTAAFDLRLFAVVLCVVVGVRPVARLLSQRAHSQHRRATRQRRPEPALTDVVHLDELGILLAAMLTHLLEPMAAAAAVAAVLVAQVLLDGGTRWWESRRAAAPAESRR